MAIFNKIFVLKKHKLTFKTLVKLYKFNLLKILVILRLFQKISYLKPLIKKFF